MRPDRPESLAPKIATALDRLGRARRIHRQSFATKHQLTPLQVDLVATLADGPPPPPLVGHLADEVGVAQPTATDSLRALERKGLVERRRDPEDSRRVLVHLTDTGQHVAADLDLADADIVAAIEALPDEVQETTLEALLSLIANLVDTGAITVARTCLNCHHHRFDGATHHCTLLGADLAPGELRVNCPEHVSVAVGIRR